MTVITVAKTVLNKIRRRCVLKVDPLETSLKRCLTVFELTFVGLSLMISGIFVTIPTVVNRYAGPSVVFSFVFAGIAAVLSAFSYAEMGSRIPRAGSGYVYASMSLGELWGFLVGWNMILEYALSCAAMSRSLSSTLLVIIGGPNNTVDLHIDFTIFGERTDTLAACFVIFFTIIVALGVKLASVLNSVMNITALGLLLAVAVICFIYGNAENWIAEGAGTFFPRGASGVLMGGSICYFSYIGFESVTVSSEETINPKKSIPIAIGLVFTVATLGYVISSLGLTYFIPTSQFEPNMPIAKVFMTRGFVISAIIVGVAGLFAVGTNMIIALYALPRVTYAMAADGLLFKPFMIINTQTRTPIFGIIVSGFFVAIVTFIFELKSLMEAVSSGTLISYISVAIGVIVLRFEVYDPGFHAENLTEAHAELSSKSGAKEMYVSNPGERKPWVMKNRFLKRYWPNVSPNIGIAVMVFVMAMLALTEAVAIRLDLFTAAWNIVLAVPLTLALILCVINLYMYEQNEPEEGAFRIPLVPLIPALSILMNFEFIMMLSYITWIRLAVWIAIGVLVYFIYSIRNSVNKEEVYLLSDEVQMDPTPKYGSGQLLRGRAEENEKKTKIIEIG